MRVFHSIVMKSVVTKIVDLCVTIAVVAADDVMIVVAVMTVEVTLTLNFQK